jgi:putative tryptophan/tyrosine transport system substrate-binding protein
MASHIERRKFLFLATLGGAATWPLAARAQQAAPKRPLIGLLAAGSKAAGERYYGRFQEGMREFGYVEGRDYAFESLYADGDFARLPLLAEELVRRNPDVIIASNTSAALAIKQSTTSIPIVVGSMTDPVGSGLVVSEARPGTNVTGMRTNLEGLPGKQLELAREVVGPVAKIAVLFNAKSPSSLWQRQDVETTAARLGVAVVPFSIQTADEAGPAVQTIGREGASIIVVLADAMFLSIRRQIAAYALASRLPTVYAWREHVEDGGLISYGTDLRERFRRTAYFVDKILKGTKPADLPIEFPAKLELVINLATAKALGLEVPPTLLARADEVIE